MASDARIIHFNKATEVLHGPCIFSRIVIIRVNVGCQRLLLLRIHDAEVGGSSPTVATKFSYDKVFCKPTKA